MKCAILWCIMLFFCGILNASSIPIEVEAISHEESEVDGSISISFRLVAFDSVSLDSNFTLILPDGWELVEPSAFEPIDLVPDDTLVQTITFSYSTDVLPFFPVAVRLSMRSIPESEELLSAKAYVYFTPYETVEVWSYFDFVHLQRDWYIPTEPAPTRIYVNPDSIPLSNMDIEYEPEEEWQELFQMVHIPGLAYGIPMLATHPDTLALDTSDVLIPDSSTRWDNCGLGRRRYQGTIDGTVFSQFEYNHNQSIPILPLEGLLIQIWEDDGPTFSDKLGETVTDAEGFFSATINTCQALENGEIEVWVRVVAKNDEYNIIGKNQRNLGSVVSLNTGVVSLAYNNGNIAPPIHFNSLVVDNGAHRAVHLAQSAFRFTNAFSGITLDDGLTIRADIDVNNNQFIPNFYCSFPVPSSVLDAFADILVWPAAVVLNLINSNKPNILLRERGARVENTTLHEFGHFVLWQLQGNCMTEPLSLTDDGHCWDCFSNPRLAWNEGWPSAFAMMVDNANFDWDEESEFYGDRSMEDLDLRDTRTTEDQGFSSEYLVACAVFDLWDGADKFANRAVPVGADHYNDFNNTNNPRWWQNGSLDEVSISFEDLCTAVIEGDHNAPHDVIESIQGYFNNVIKWRGCEDRRKIVEVFNQNHIVGFIENFPGGDFQGFSNDEILAVETYTFAGTLWSMNFQHEYNIDILANAPDEDYNLATQIQNGSTFLSDDLRVIDGATLHFNKNIPIGWVIDNSAARPALNSTMETILCSGMTLEVMEGGNVIVGDQAVTAHADVALKPGGTIILGGDSPTNTGSLLINNHSRLYIESGATLIIDQGAAIELAGNDAVLEIDGNLIIRDGATFTFTGSGHVVWGNGNAGDNVTCEANSAIVLDGSGKTDPILYLKAGTHIQPEQSLAEFELVDGAVFMGDGASISTADADYVLDNLDVQLDGTTGQHKGIYVHGQAAHLIQDVEISGALKGITAYQDWNQGATLKLSNCEFHDNEVGLQVHRKGVIMTSCDFHDNGIGYAQDMADVLSRVQFCDFEDNETGIEFVSGNGDLYFRESHADDNIDGIRFSGLGNLYGKCGSTHSNTQNGITLAFGADLRFNDWLNASGTQHRSTSNAYSIAALFAHSLDLYEGRNDLVPIQYNANRDVYGYMLIPNTTTTTLKSHHNHWNNVGSSTGTSPGYNTDYLLANLNSGNLYPVFLQDNSPIASPTCSYTSGGGGGSTLRNCGECSVIRTASFNDVPLDSAIRTAMRYMELVDSTQNDSMALVLFAEIAGAYPDDPNAEESYLIDAVQTLAKTSFNSACASGRISLEDPIVVGDHPLVQAMQAVLQEAPQDGAVEAFLASLEDLLFDHTQGFMDTTLIQLDSLIQLSMTGFESYLDYASCYVEAEIQVIADPSLRDAFDDMVANCMSSKWREDDLLHDGSLERFAAGLYQDFSMMVYPSPSNGDVWLEVTCPGVEMAPPVRVWDAMGRQMELPVKVELARGPLFRYRLDAGNLAAGVYVIQVDAASFAGGGKVASRKFVVNE